jgi:hypothetical protein
LELWVSAEFIFVEQYGCGDEAYCASMACQSSFPYLEQFEWVFDVWVSVVE